MGGAEHLWRARRKARAFELRDEKGLLAFRTLHGGPELYEAEIERLV
jgi:hypothetical protein